MLDDKADWDVMAVISKNNPARTQIYEEIKLLKLIHYNSVLHFITCTNWKDNQKGLTQNKYKIATEFSKMEKVQSELQKKF